MCNLYTMTAPVDELRRVFGPFDGERDNRPPFNEIYWRPGEGISFMAFLTCAPNTTVGAAHPKAMPVILARDDLNRWLGDEQETTFSVARAYSDDLMRVVGYHAASPNVCNGWKADIDADRHTGSVGGLSIRIN